MTTPPHSSDDSTPDTEGQQESSATSQHHTLRDRTIFITGGSRGIGKAIALRAARDGANIVFAAKTSEPHPKLEGTIHSAAQEVEAAGGKALPIQCDVRDEQQVASAVAQAVEHFGGIDVLVNNASALSLSDTESTSLKRYDLMQSVNVRGTFVTTQACLPHLKSGNDPHVLTLSPPLNLKPEWFAPQLAYALSKYGMSLCVLGHAAEFKPFGIAVNALWPKTLIATAAVAHLPKGERLLAGSRSPKIMADAAYAILTRPSTFTGNFCLDEDTLRQSGVSDFTGYATVPGQPLLNDLFV